MSDKIREQLAEYAHDAWSGWMAYLFEKGAYNKDGSFTIHPQSVERWKRQMNTPFNNLPEGEKESDRKEADRILGIFHE